MKIRELFVEDVTRSIPPVVYFHQQSPESIAAEVGEYIITGGWNEDHPSHRRVPNGIHEQYVKLLRGISRELGKEGGPDLPNVWISGFYGSGKSSFAKLLGLSLDGATLPDGTSLSQAWLARNRSQRKQEMIDAWTELRSKVNPIAVVFDVGALARDNEHVHAVAIRGLLQLLGDLFSDLKLADDDFGRVVSLDQIYEIQHTALDSDTQSSMARIMNKCAELKLDLALRAAKAVALLEMIQESEPTTPELVAKCLYDRLGVGDQVSEVKEALELLRSQGLLGYSDKLGYKIQSSAGEEWERDRRDGGATPDKISEYVLEALKDLLAAVEKPKLNDRPFPLAGLFNDGRVQQDAKVHDPRDPASVVIDFRFLPSEDRAESTWIKKSDESALKNRLVWVCGENDLVKEQVSELAKSQRMVNKYQQRRDSLSEQKKSCLREEEGKLEEGLRKVKDKVAECWKSGAFYFRGERYEAKQLGDAFSTSANRAAARILKELFNHFDGTIISPAEIEQLLQKDLVGPSAKFMRDELGILDLDEGRYEPTCSGVVPGRINDKIRGDGGIGGSALLTHFGGPPYGYRPEVVKACVAGLIRASKLKVQMSDGGAEINSLRDVGTQDLFSSDRDFRRADFFPADESDINPGQINKIRKFFEEEFNLKLERDMGAIADAVETHFHGLNRQVTDVLTLLQQMKLPSPVAIPPEFSALKAAIEKCLAKVRQSKPTVQQVKKNLDALRDGIRTLKLFSGTRRVADCSRERDWNAGQADRHDRATTSWGRSFGVVVADRQGGG